MTEQRTSVRRRGPRWQDREPTPARPDAAYSGHVLKVLLVVIVFAAVTYAVVRLLERRGTTPVRRSRPNPRPVRRPMAPDDDEDFLRDLDRRRRHPEDPDGTGS